MHSLVNDLAKKLNLSASEAEEAVSGLLIRIRAGLETIGEVEIEGLGTFKSDDGRVTFEPAVEFVDEVNKEFAGMKPVALTSTGESVDPTDRRALPGVDTSQTGGSGTAVEPSAREHPAGRGESPSPDLETQPETESEDSDLEEEGVSGFTSPPPPFPSKIRVPPSERRSSRRSRPEAKESNEFPDMGSVVTTRPVEPIGNGIPSRRRKSKAPMAIGVGVVTVVLVSWLLLGGGESEPPQDESVSEISSSDRPDEDLPMASVASSRTETQPVEEMAAETAPDSEPAAVDPVAGETQEPPVTEEIEEQVAVQPVVEQEVVASAQQTDENVEEVDAAPDSGPAYAWIVASYPSREEAENRVDRMRQEGYEANVYEATVRGEPAFRVGIGRFESEAAAWRSHDTVPPEVADAWITRVN